MSGYLAGARVLCLEVVTLVDVSRDVLPIPVRRRVGLGTFDAKDPETSYPPIASLRPPAGAVSHDGVVLTDAGGAVVGPQSPHGGDGWDYGDRYVGAGLQLVAAEHGGTVG